MEMATPALSAFTILFAILGGTTLPLGIPPLPEDAAREAVVCLRGQFYLRNDSIDFRTSWGHSMDKSGVADVSPPLETPRGQSRVPGGKGASDVPIDFHLVFCHDVALAGLHDGR